MPRPMEGEDATHRQAAATRRPGFLSLIRDIMLTYACLVTFGAPYTTLPAPATALLDASVAPICGASRSIGDAGLQPYDPIQPSRIAVVYGSATEERGRILD